MSAEAARAYEEQQRRRREEEEREAAKRGAVATGRGRGADTPGEIPASGWKDVLWRTYQEITNDRVLLVAAGVTFYLLLALAPLLAAFVSIYGLFLDPAEIAAQASALAGVVPGGAVDILTGQLERLAQAGGSTLGIAFLVSLAIALWSANAGMKSLFEAMNVAYDEREGRSFLKLNAVTMTFTVSLIATVIALIAFNTAFTTFQESVGLKIPNWIVNLVTAGIALLVLMTFIAALYRYGPDREDAEWKWITPGAVFAAIAAIVVSVLFSFYVANFGSYNETYGSLGAVIGFMTWLWLMLTVIVLGGELNSEIEHQTAQDTTTGHDEPMGERGAVKADTVGETYG